MRKRTASYRRVGAVGTKPLVYRHARTVLATNHDFADVLDFGSGWHADNARKLKAAFPYLNMWIHDDRLEDSAIGGLLRLQEPWPERYFDLILLSNVLNVQESRNDFHVVLTNAATMLNKHGILIANFPKSPRYHEPHDGGISFELTLHFEYVKHVGDDVFVCRFPRRG